MASGVFLVPPLPARERQAVLDSIPVLSVLVGILECQRHDARFRPVGAGALGRDRVHRLLASSQMPQRGPEDGSGLREIRIELPRLTHRCDRFPVLLQAEVCRAEHVGPAGSARESSEAARSVERRSLDP